jgi:hypothetical protein
MTKAGRKKVFGAIPTSVDDAYTAILNQSTDKEQAIKLLQIIFTARRPLSVQEIMIAISIQEDDEAHTNIEVHPEAYSKKQIRNLCRLFDSVINGRVHFPPQTAKEFLVAQGALLQETLTPEFDGIWRRLISSQHSNFVLAHICMWYLRLHKLITLEPVEF